MAAKRTGRPVYPITSARRGLSADVAHRQSRYVISMGIRTVCFVLAVVMAVAFRRSPLVWVFLVGAFVLPYLSVVYANAGREQRGKAANFTPGSTELPPGGPAIGPATDRTIKDDRST